MTGAALQQGYPAWLLPRSDGGDDTQAIIDANAVNQPLGPGTFQVSGLIPSMPRGQGPSTTLHATAAAAAIRHGPALGTTPLGDSGRYGGFVFDGAGSAGASNPVVLLNAFGATYDPIIVHDSASDGVVLSGYGCTLLNPRIYNIVGDCFAFDGGCYGNVIVAPQLLSASGYHLAFRETVASPLPGFSVPTGNRIIKGSTAGNFAAANLGSVHHLAGFLNTLDGMQLAVPPGSPGIFQEVNTFIGRASDLNGHLKVKDCYISGGTSAIASGSTALTSDIAVVLQGENFFTGQSGGVAIPWTNSKPVRKDGLTVLSGGTTSEYSASGSAPAGVAYGLASPDVGSSRNEDINPAMTAAAKTGSWIWVGVTGGVNGGEATNSTNAINDAIAWDRQLSQGTWEWEIVYQTGANRGICSIQLDGTTVGTLDMYNASTLSNQIATGSFTVPYTGNHRLNFAALTHNASSSGYTLTLSWITLRRTA